LKLKGKKEIICIIILVPLFLFISLNFTDKGKNWTANYTVLNKGDKGFSGIYKTLKKLKYPVKLEIKNLKNEEKDSLQIIVQSRNFDIESEQVKDWIYSGGKLLCLKASDNDKNIFYGQTIKQKEDIFTTVQYGEGYIILANGDSFTNGALLKSTDNAYSILEEVDRLGYKELCFNEFYIYSGNETSWWGNMPIAFKVIIYQLIFFIVAIIFARGKRFGKIVPLYEETERTENEYIYSVASIYKQGKCWDVIIESYYEEFIGEFRKGYSRLEEINKENWHKYWEKEQLPSSNKAKKLQEFMIDKNKKVKAKEYIQMVQTIEQLKKTLKKRRENHWKELKR